MEPGLNTWFKGADENRASLTAAIGHAGYQYLHLRCLDDRWHTQGDAILHVHKKFLVDSKGCFVQGSYLGASDGYYKHYIEHQGEPNCLPNCTFHHLCLCRAKDCPARTREGFVIHIDEWQWVAATQVKRLLREWGYRQLPLLEAEPLMMQRRSHASAPAVTHHSESDDSGSNLGQGANAHERESEEEQPPAPNRRARRARRTRPKRKVEADAEAALDEVLAQDDTREDRAPGHRSKTTLLSEGLSKLHKQLGVGEGKRERKRGSDPAAALAAKAATAAAKRPPSKKPKTDLAATLLKALRKEEAATDEELEDDEKDADDDSDVLAGLHSRRQKLRNLAKQHPGRLLVAGMQNFAEHLGQAFGDSSDDPLRPLATRYLLSVVAPSYPGQTLSDADYRELRSLAEMLDQLVRGETATLGDFLVQRFKAKLMATRDASWGAAKYLELIPIDPIHHGTTVEEEEWVRKLRIREAKLDDALRKSR